jgi:ethanolamine utilization protein EutQ (cupin superfamily)
MKKFICTLATATLFATAGQAMAEMTYFEKKQQDDISSLNIEGINVFLQDFTTSNDKKSPMSCGMFRMERGNSLTYTYSYDETKIMLEGEMTLAHKSGKTVTLHPGDSVSFDKGDTITFSSKTSGTAFYCGQREFGKL